MKKLYILWLGLALALSACNLVAPEPTATPLPTVDTAATADVIAKTMVAETLAAIPTNTPLPTATDTPVPTETPLPSETPSITPTPTLGATPTFFNVTMAPGGVSGKQGFIRVENNTKFSTVIITVDGVSANGNDPIYLSWQFEKVLFFNIPFGDYRYRITFSNKNFSGSFKINNDDKTTIRVFDTKIVIVGP